MTFKVRGRTRVLQAIYRLQGDVLQIAEDARERPKSFKTDGATRAMVYSFKRRPADSGAQPKADAQPKAGD